MNLCDASGFQVDGMISGEDFRIESEVLGRSDDSRKTGWAPRNCLCVVDKMSREKIQQKK